MPRNWPDRNQPHDPGGERRLQIGLGLFIAGWVLAGAMVIDLLFLK